MSTEDQVRVTVRVPEKTRDQLNDYAEAIGVRPSHFVSMALLRGAQELAKEFNVLLRRTCDMPGCDKPVMLADNPERITVSGYSVSPNGEKEPLEERIEEYYWCPEHQEKGGFDLYTDYMSGRLDRSREPVFAGLNVH